MTSRAQETKPAATGPTPQPRPPHHPDRPRIIGLDGLRALAACLVLVYHLVPGAARIGYVGVDVFFVISGFLITSLLLRERTLTGRVDTPHFWARRFRRLVPAVVVTTLVCVALAALVGGDVAAKLRGQTLGALTGTYNWFQVANGSSYFESTSPLLLTNFWSLGVEQQFYVVWPFVLLAILAFARRRWVAPALALTLAAGSVSLHVAFLGDDVTRSYVGTDTHAFGLMIGAALALALPDIMVSRRRAASPWWGALSLVCLGLLVAAALAVPDSRWMYPWGLLAASLLAAGVIRGLLPDVRTGPGPVLARALESRPMRWLGERSHGIYLWHWPLWVLATATLDAPGWAIATGVSALTLLAAHISFTYVENPIRREGFVAWLRRLGTTSVPRLAAVALAFAVVTTTAAVGVATSPSETSAEAAVREGREALASASAAATGEAPTPEPTPTLDTTATPEPSPSATSEEASPTPSAEPASTEPTRIVPTHAPGTPVAGTQVSVIGDSVALAASPALLAHLPGIVIDAEVSRFPWDFAGVADRMAVDGTLREYVVVALGTNGLISNEDLRVMMTKLGPNRKIVFVTAYGPKNLTWIEQSNQQIAKAAAQYPDQVRVADWAAIASQHEDLLADDGIHRARRPTSCMPPRSHRRWRASSEDAGVDRARYASPRI